MGFFLILLILLFIFLWPAIKAALTVNSARRRFADLQREAQRQAQREQQRQQARTSAPRPRKVYGRDEGEYVDFEEVTDTTHTTTSSPDTAPEVTEQQVADAEWEEIRRTDNGR